MDLIRKLNKWYQSLDQKIFNQKSISLARKIYFLWVFVNYSILATKADFFYSAHNYIALKDLKNVSVLEKGINFLNIPEYNFLYSYFLFAVLIAAIVGISGRFQRITSLITFILMVNLDNRAYVTLDGGNNLVHLIGFYLVFINTQENKNKTSILVTNLAALMIQIQICLVYATAGLLKVMGPLWNKGVALYYTMGVPEYGNEHLFKIFSQFPIIVVLFTFGTVLFQISFPYLIWNKHLRPLMILIGTSLHFSISFVMGLFMFGAAMCMSYFFFKTDQDLYEN